MRQTISPDCDLGDRLRELAQIFGKGVIRWRQRQRRLETPNSINAGLEVSLETVLSVTNPVNGPENQRLGAPA